MQTQCGIKLEEEAEEAVTTFQKSNSGSDLLKKKIQRKFDELKFEK